MIGRPDILKVIFRYLAGEIDLSSFRERIVESDLEGHLDHDARTLLHQIEGKYAEFADGLVNEEFLRERFREIMNPTANAVANPAHTVVLLENVQHGQIVIGQIQSGSSSEYSSVPPSGSINLSELEVSQ